jgi:uncharacterized protein (DUF1697 family)
MQTFISILRGINVSGQKKIVMADLKALYENLGYKGVDTYIQSGNVVFKTAKIANTELASTIEQEIFRKYNFHVPVIVRTAEEMKNIISTNPFIADKDIDIEKLHITFLAETPSQADLESIKTLDYPPDKFIIIGKEVFLYCPVNYGETKLSNKFFESKLKTSATTRNWKTVNKLLEIALR